MKDNLNIVYFLSQYPKVSESFVINEIHDLEQRGHSISVFSLRSPENSIRHSEQANMDVSVSYLPSPSLRSIYTLVRSGISDPSLIPNSMSNNKVKPIFGNLYILRHFKNFLSRIDPDIVHSHFVNWPRLAAQSAADSLDIPFTVTAHAHGLFINSPVTKHILTKAEQVFTVSDYNKNYIKNNYVDRSNIDVVRMGIDPTKFSPSSSINVGDILCVGRFVEKKGFHYALEAFANLSGNEYTIRFVGDGPLKDLLLQKVEELDIANQVEFLGRVSDTELIRQYDQADVFLLPCIQASDGDMDGIPVSLMEAMAMRTIPVSTAISGIPELIIHGKNGFLAQPKNINNLTKMLNRALTLGDNSIIRNNARESVLNEFTIKNNIDRLETKFHQLHTNSN